MYITRVADMAWRWREHGTAMAIAPRWLVLRRSPVELLARPSIRFSSTDLFEAIEVAAIQKANPTVRHSNADADRKPVVRRVAGRHSTHIDVLPVSPPALLRGLPRVFSARMA
jgi:hypothetical protein